MTNNRMTGAMKLEHPKTVATSQAATSQASLAASSYDDLQEVWASAFHSPAPATFSRDMLVRGILWRSQIAEHGDIKPETMATLATAAKAAQARRTKIPGPSQAKAVATIRYVRVWLGATHVVEEIDGAYLWQGKSFRSLSGVAKAITGTHWNGPLFFGLRDRRAWGHRSKTPASPNGSTVVAEGAAHG